MFRLFRSLVEKVVRKIRNLELFVFNVALVRRRGTIHSICGKDVPSKFRKTALSRRRETIHSICEVRSAIIVPTQLTVRNDRHNYF
jgi:hypothetical protein